MRQRNSKGGGNHAFQSFKIQVTIGLMVGFFLKSLILVIQESYILFTKYVFLLKKKIQPCKCKVLPGLMQESKQSYVTFNKEKVL